MERANYRENCAPRVKTAAIFVQRQQTDKACLKSLKQNEKAFFKEIIQKPQTKAATARSNTHSVNSEEATDPTGETFTGISRRARPSRWKPGHTLKPRAARLGSFVRARPCCVPGYVLWPAVCRWAG